MQTNKDWKYYLGLTLLVYSLLPEVLAAALFGILHLVHMHLTHTQSVSIVVAIVASAEVAFLIAVALLGKPFVQLIKSKVKSFLNTQSGETKREEQF